MAPLFLHPIRPVRLFCTLIICFVLALTVLPFELTEAEVNQLRKGSEPTTDQSFAETRSEAQRAVERGDALCTSWTKTSFLGAINEYKKAAVLASSVSDQSSAAHANLKVGDVQFILSEFTEALDSYQEAQQQGSKASDWLLVANALSRTGRVNSFRGQNDLAQQQLKQALVLFKQQESNLNDVAANAYGEALTNLAEVSYSKGDFVSAREQLHGALNLFRNYPSGEGKAHLFNSYILGSIGDSEKAVAEINLARDLYRKANDKIGEGQAISALGLSYSFRRDVKTATDLHNQAIDIFRVAGDRIDEAYALNGLGQAFEGVNDYALAQVQYEQSLRLLTEINATDGLAVANFKLGSVHRLSGRLDQALAFYEKAVQLSRAAGKFRSEAIALTEIARVYVTQGRRELAKQQFLKLQKFYETIGDFRGQTVALNTYSDFLLQSGDNKGALDASQRALILSERIDDKGVLISTLFSLARLNLKIGDPDAALPLVRRSLEIIEDLRANVASPDFRVSYLSGVGKHYELCIEILMTLERLHPDRGYAAEALIVSEKARARLLLDLVNESRNQRQGAAQALLDRDRELRELFRAQAQYRMNLVADRKDASEIKAVDDQLAQFRAEYQQIQAQLRQQNRVSAAPSLSVQRIQHELENDDTMLLEYSLGDTHSYLWAVTSSTLTSLELPPRKVIEDAARELYGLLTARQENDGQADSNYQTKVQVADTNYVESAARLSQILLGSVAKQLGSRRLLVVTEGALQFIPLEALLLPDGTSETFLIERNETVALPSIGALIAIRTERHRTSAKDKLVAVLADPVFSSSDDRVGIKGSGSGSALATSQPDVRTRSGALARLTYASEEADAISKVAPWGTMLLAKGFDANRETAMSPNTGQYQIVHFATHGLLNSERPELSGILLSSVDRDGKSTNGLMTLHDINSLNLSSELTVLSACQSASGKEIKGEGLIGLTHSFLSAGSNTVIASLWKVDDRATAVLMADFYQSMLQQGMSPSAALRSAKLKLMKDKRWSAPYYWAGFVLEGEYTNHIAVTRHSWVRVGLLITSVLALLIVAVLIIEKRQRPGAVMPQR